MRQAKIIPPEERCAARPCERREVEVENGKAYCFQHASPATKERRRSEKIAKANALTDNKRLRSINADLLEALEATTDILGRVSWADHPEAKAIWNRAVLAIEKAKS